jgi:hypothetical protein
MANLLVPATVLFLATVATVLRKAAPRWRWLVGVLCFAALTVVHAMETHPPQSEWANVPIIGGATFASVLVASREPFHDRPLVGFVVSLVAAFVGFLVGMITAIELGRLRS